MTDRTLAHDDTKNIRIVVFAGVGLIILVVLLVWLRSYFFLVRNETVYTNVLSVKNPKLVELRAREDAQLGSYAWVDKEKGIVQIPIDRAMELVVRESSSPEKGEGR
jgi:hypothetical protein